MVLDTQVDESAEHVVELILAVLLFVDACEVRGVVVMDRRGDLYALDARAVVLLFPV